MICGWQLACRLNQNGRPLLEFLKYKNVNFLEWKIWKIAGITKNQNKNFENQDEFQVFLIQNIFFMKICTWNSRIERFSMQNKYEIREWKFRKFQKLLRIKNYINFLIDSFNKTPTMHHFIKIFNFIHEFLSNHTGVIPHQTNKFSELFTHNHLRFISFLVHLCLNIYEEHPLSFKAQLTMVSEKNNLFRDLYLPKLSSYNHFCPWWHV